MLGFVVRRLLTVIPLAVGITLMMFVVTHVIPADPAATLLGDQATPEVIDAFKRRWGLDKPLYQQYLTYLGNLAHGDLGTSIRTGNPVDQDIADRLPATIELAVAALLFSVVFGVTLGIVAAVDRGRWVDGVIRIVSLVGVSAPVFWTGVLLIFLFYYLLQWLPSSGRLGMTSEPPPHVTGLYTLDALLAGNLSLFAESLKYLALPAFSLGLHYMAFFLRITRSGIIDELQRDYVRTARSKGLRARSIVLGHALKNALIPLLSYGGIAFGGLLSGAVVTETIFSWPGIGSYAFQNATSLDFPVITSVTLVIALIYVLVNLAVDVVQAAVDPRIVVK